VTCIAKHRDISAREPIKASPIVFGHMVSRVTFQKLAFALEAQFGLCYRSQAICILSFYSNVAADRLLWHERYLRLSTHADANKAIPVIAPNTRNGNDARAKRAVLWAFLVLVAFLCLFCCCHCFFYLRRKAADRSTKTNSSGPRSHMAFWSPPQRVSIVGDKQLLPGSNADALAASFKLGGSQRLWMKSLRGRIEPQPLSTQGHSRSIEGGGLLIGEGSVRPEASGLETSCSTDPATAETQFVTMQDTPVAACSMSERKCSAMQDSMVAAGCTSEGKRSATHDGSLAVQAHFDGKSSAAGGLSNWPSMLQGSSVGYESAKSSAFSGLSSLRASAMDGDGMLPKVLLTPEQEVPKQNSVLFAASESSFGMRDSDMSCAPESVRSELGGASDRQSSVARLHSTRMQRSRESQPVTSLINSIVHNVARSHASFRSGQSIISGGAAIRQVALDSSRTSAAVTSGTSIGPSSGSTSDISCSYPTSASSVSSARPVLLANLQRPCHRTPVKSHSLRLPLSSCASFQQRQQICSSDSAPSSRFHWIRGASSSSTTAHQTCSDSGSDVAQLTFALDRQWQASSFSGALEPLAEEARVGAISSLSPLSASGTNEPTGVGHPRLGVDSSRLISLSSVHPQATPSSYSSFQGFHPLPPLFPLSPAEQPSGDYSPSNGTAGASSPEGK
jgi:hypothetical protein